MCFESYTSHGKIFYLIPVVSYCLHSLCKAFGPLTETITSEHSCTLRKSVIFPSGVVMHVPSLVI